MQTFFARGKQSLRNQVLVLDEEVPLPANSGKRLRTLNLLSRLASEFAIDLLVHKDQATHENLFELAQKGITVHVVPRRIPAKHGILFPLRLAYNLASPLPYSVATHYNRQYRRSLRHLLATRRYDLIHCEWTPYAQYRDDSPLPWVVSAHSVEFQIWTRLSKNASDFPRRLFLGLQAKKMQRFEKRVFSEFSFATAVSEADAATLQGLGCAKVAVVRNGVDTNHFTTQSNVSVEPRSLVFSASMDWRPNQDALTWFLEAIHPLLCREVDYRLYVVGRSPPAWMLRPGRFPRQILVTGTVPDVRPYIARAAISVVPLRAGGGSRLKILEALSMAKPVVSTRMGAEGLDVENGTHILLADEPQDFASAVLSLFTDPARSQQLGATGHSLVRARYDWADIASVQAAFWREILASRAALSSSQFHISS